jgi:hypothetical protein
VQPNARLPDLRKGHRIQPGVLLEPQEQLRQILTSYPRSGARF